MLIIKFSLNKILLLLIPIIALIDFIILFFINGHIWIYLYFLLWFLLISEVWVYFYGKFKKNLYKLLENKTTIISFLILLLAMYFVFLFLMRADALPRDYWFVIMWDSIRMAIFGFAILFFSFRIIHISTSNGYKIELFSSIVNRIEIIRNVSTVFKRVLLKPITIILKIGCILLIIFLILFQTFFFAFFPYLIQPIMHYKAESSVEELQNIVDEITKNCETDEEKTRAILDWMERYSGKMYNIWGVPLISGVGAGKAQLKFAEGKPYHCILCLRIYGRNDPLWILTSRCGACEEHALLFREMAHTANIPVRSIHAYEMDHCWAEVLINNSWIAVDPSRVVHKDNNTGYNINKSSYEKESHFKSHNLSYVFAEYPNLQRKKVDVTKNYTNISYVNISTIDLNNNSVPHVEIHVFSKNANEGIEDVELNFITNETGKYKLEIGGGTVIFESKDKNRMLYNKTTKTLYEHESVNLTISMETKRETANYFRPFLIVLWSFYMVGSLLLIIFYRKWKSKRGTMKKLSNIGEKIRDYINKKNLYDIYFKGKLDDWNAFCVALDTLDDSCLSLLYFESHGLGRQDGEKYLKLYGLFQSIFLQQDAISEIYQIFVKKKLNPATDSNWMKIRNLRNLTAGHPIKKTSGGKGLQRCFISRVTISEKGFQLIIWNKNKDKDELEKVDLSSLYDAYKLEAIEYLEEVYQTMVERWGDY